MPKTPASEDEFSKARQKKQQSKYRDAHPPTHPDGSPILGSFDPAEMGPEFDVAHLLAHNADRFLAGADAVATRLRRFPHMCKMNIERLRYSVEGREVGINPTIVACLGWGLAVLAANESVQNFVEVRRRFLTCDNSVDPETYSIINGLFKDVGLGLGAGGESFLRMPESVHTEVSSMASSLGMSRETLIGLATYVTLAEQPSTMVFHAKEMKTTIESVWRRLDLRAEIIKGAVKAFLTIK